MKSAFELAMERLGGTIRQYSDDQKEQLAEVDRRFEAKIAQAKFAADDRRRKAGRDAEALGRIEDDLAVEIRSIEAQRERRKDELRKQFDTGGAPA